MSWMLLLKEALKKVAAPLLMELGKVFIGKLGEAPSINNTSKPLDIEQISDALEELRNLACKEAQPLFEKINKSIVDYVEDGFMEIDDRMDLLDKYDISSSDTIGMLRNIQREANSYWQEKLYKRISIDNAKCRSILMLPAGDKKEAEMAQFVQDVIMETMLEQTENLREEMESICSLVEKRVQRSAQKLENIVKDYSLLVDSVDTQDEEKIERIVSNAALKKDICSMVYGKAGE